MRILLAIDGSSCSMKAVDFVLDRLWAEDDQIFVVGVVEVMPRDVGLGHVYSAEVHNDSETNKFQELTFKIANRLEVKFPENKVESKVLYGQVVDEVCQVAKDKSADLIIMGSHSRKGIEHFLLGSVAENVLKKAPCSVQIVK